MATIVGGPIGDGKTAAWIVSALHEYATMAQAKSEAKKTENGKWKYDKPSGNGTTTAYFVCNAHEKCGRKMKVAKGGGVCHIFYKGKHTAVPTKGARKNSTLTWEQDAELKKAIDQGAKPGQIRVSMLKAKAGEHHDAGHDPLAHKDAEGGLEGQ